MPIANTAATISASDGCDSTARSPPGRTRSRAARAARSTSRRRRSTTSASSPPSVERNSKRAELREVQQADVEPASAVSFKRVRTEHDVLHPRADVRRERAEVDDAEVAVPERGLRGAPLERDVAVDERVLELLTRELVEFGLLVLQHPVTLPTSSRYSAEVRDVADHVLGAQARELVVGHAELAQAPRRCAGRASAPGPSSSARARPTCAPATSGTPGDRRADGRAPRRTRAPASADRRASRSPAPSRPPGSPAARSSAAAASARRASRTTRRARSAAIGSDARSTATHASSPSARYTPPVPAPVEQRPVDRVPDHLLGGDRGRDFDQRHLDELALAGARPVLERGDDRERRVRADHRVDRTAGDDRRPALVAGHPRHAGELLHRLREPGPVAPRAVSPNAGMRTITTSGRTARTAS